jgi:hypothetical protein
LDGFQGYCAPVLSIGSLGGWSGIMTVVDSLMAESRSITNVEEDLITCRTLSVLSECREFLVIPIPSRLGGCLVWQV